MYLIPNSVVTAKWDTPCIFNVFIYFQLAKSFSHILAAPVRQISVLAFAVLMTRWVPYFHSCAVSIFAPIDRMFWSSCRRRRSSRIFVHLKRWLMFRILYACHLDLLYGPTLLNCYNLSEVSISHKYLTSKEVALLTHCVKAFLVEIRKLVAKDECCCLDQFCSTWFVFKLTSKPNTFFNLIIF